MLDQELSLFYDTAPILSITDLQCPLPGPEIMWVAASADSWLAALQNSFDMPSNIDVHMLAGQSFTQSLLELFQGFLQDGLSGRQASLSPHQLRLLLHPLQSMVYHNRQILSCISGCFDTGSSTLANGTSRTKSGTMERLHEVRALLQKWHELATAFEKAKPNCPVTQCNLVLYHLVSLNLAANFPEIERFARREGGRWEGPAGGLRNSGGVLQRHEIVMHCGQVFKRLRLMPVDRRPNWWGAAVYRATLILWMDSISRLGPNFQPECGVGVGGSGGTGEAGNMAAAGAPSTATNGTAAAAAINGTGGNSNGASGAAAAAGGNGNMASAAGAGAGSRSVVVLDQGTPEEILAMAWCWGRDNPAPVLTGQDGEAKALEWPSDVLSYGIDILDETVSSRIADGIRRKLRLLGDTWKIGEIRRATA